MILESSYWKDELFRIAQRMRRRRTQKRWVDASYHLLEKDVFIAFFAIRKLIEAKAKLSPSITDRPIQLVRYRPNPDSNVTLLNRHRIHEHYDLSKGSQCRKQLKFICDQFVHSYVFEPFFLEEGSLFQGVYFSSDQNRNAELYALDGDDLIELLERVSSDYPTSQGFEYS